MEEMVIDTSFWVGRRVLVTGHTGFKGAWLALWLNKLGAVVHGAALPPPTSPNLFEDAGLADLISHHHIDIRNFDDLRALITEIQPEVIFHLAAQSLVRYSYSAPVDTYAVNVMGTVHVLEAARQTSSVRAIVNVTSDKCYENREWVWGYRESDPMGGFDPYSSSKGCAELVTSAYRRSYFDSPESLRLASVRAGNVIGGGDWALDRLVPDAMRAFLAGKELVIRRPYSIRPWQHVLEPLRGYIMLAEKLSANETPAADGWNFGPFDSDVHTVESIVQQLSSHWEGGPGYRVESEDQLHEAHYLKLDCSKATALLHWTPLWPLSKALEKTVEWYRAYAKKSEMRDVTLAQIQCYEEEVNARSPI